MMEHNFLFVWVWFWFSFENHNLPLRILSLKWCYLRWSLGLFSCHHLLQALQSLKLLLVFLCICKFQEVAKFTV